MDVKTLTYLIENPAEVSVYHGQQLEKLVKKYPYFQAGRALRLKGLNDHQDFRYNSELKKTAAYTTDRSILFDYITSDEFNQNRIAEQIKEQETRLKDITVYEAEQVFGNRSIEIDDAIKMKKSESERVMDPELFEKPSISQVEPAEAFSEEKTAQATEVEKQLEIGKPLKFERSETHSFSEWLKLSSAKPIEREDNSEEENEDRQRKFELIEDFINKNPKIKPAKLSIKSNLADQSIVAPESLMTETLAKVYLEQKNYKKAIQAYKILILKNPEKSGFFADQIRAVEKLQDINNTH